MARRLPGASRLSAAAGTSFVELCLRIRSQTDSLLVRPCWPGQTATVAARAFILRFSRVSFSMVARCVRMVPLRLTLRVARRMRSSFPRSAALRVFTASSLVVLLAVQFRSAVALQIPSNMGPACCNETSGKDAEFPLELSDLLLDRLPVTIELPCRRTWHDATGTLCLSSSFFFLNIACPHSASQKLDVHGGI